MKRLSLSSVLLVAMLQCPSMADNWAHWRGPTGNGVATNARPPLQWSSTKNVKWKVTIPGRGSGSPWVQHIEADPTVRVQACDVIYKMRATHTSDAADLESFLAAVKRKYGWKRHQALEYREWVFRLDP